jgi:transposase InsO family protein
MTSYFTAIFAFFGSFFRSRSNLGLEIIALRQQLCVLCRKQSRPRLRNIYKLFWILLRQLWVSWKNALVIVKPETVIGWHCAGFRLYWRFLSRSKKHGAPEIASEIRTAIKRIREENATWGAPRIHGELLKLGFDVSEPTVSRYLCRLSPSKKNGKVWLTFLRDHREAIAAMDFFTVPTISFRVLYCFFVIEHARRRILHFNVTKNPTSSWIMQKLREAFPEPCPYRYVIFDRDAKFGKDVIEYFHSSGIKPKQISYRSPWQNGIAERWVRSRRRELPDLVIALNESHLRRLIREYIQYYHSDRTHDSLEKDSPSMRIASLKTGQTSQLASSLRIGGLHHRYDWQQAA